MISAYVEEAIENHKLQMSRIECPSCGVVVGQRAEDGTELIEWAHNSPCGAPCAGPRYRSHMGKKRRARARELHTAKYCPRCESKPCFVCANKCTCSRCQGDGIVWGTYADENCHACNPEQWSSRKPKILCKHNCARCDRTGYVHGLEEI